MNLGSELDTIAAIATAPGEGGIGIVRISGSEAGKIADRLFTAASGTTPLPQRNSHHAIYGKIIDETGTVIDEALCLPMWAPNSYTKEDVVELQSHGGALIVRKILELAISYGARMAEPGEFTKRAFLNGRLDLSQAQSVMDLIQARTSASLRMAAGHLQGAFSTEIAELRHACLEIIAHLEASIDFPEDDIEDIAKDHAQQSLDQIAMRVDKMLATFHTGKILRDGLVTAIVGKPNVGKSSLLNALLGEDRAIVTDIPGTTRDSLEEYANIGGVPVKIIDTAGIRETSDQVEQLGVEKSVGYVQQSDLILALFDNSRPLSSEDEEIITLLENRSGIILLTKQDLPAQLDLERLQSLLDTRNAKFKLLPISTVGRQGFEALEQEIVDLVYSGTVSQAESCFVNNVRQAKALREARQHLAQALEALAMGLAEDFIVIDIRSAWEKLGEITGDTVDEDIIDQIFSQFCIGK